MANVEVASGLALHFEDCTVLVETEDTGIIAKLRRYFGDFAADPQADDHPHSLLRVIEEEPTEPEDGLIPWMEKGKDAFLDLPSGRFVRKMRTGVTISIQEDFWSSVWTMRGPVNRNFSQVVNMIGNIFGLHLMDRGCSMIHASAVADGQGRALAIMAQSGMGKSSVAVRLMEQGFDFISNDRVILEPPLTDDNVIAHGLPKLPRVNPGTLLDGEHTRIVLDPTSRQRYESLPREELWQVEDKYDIEVDRVLGRRWILSGDLKAVLVLNWQHGGEGIRLQKLTPGQALAEFNHVRKDFGVFDVRLVSRSDAAMAETARRVPVYRVTGRADPSRLAEELRRGLVPELA
jgi:HprK-related kinase B